MLSNHAAWVYISSPILQLDEPLPLANETFCHKLHSVCAPVLEQILAERSAGGRLSLRGVLSHLLEGGAQR